jgi:ATP-dependent helicase Lhr and Lhr-like helicase
MAAELIHFLTVPPSREVAEQGLHADLRQWFATTYATPTLAQRFAWPAICARQNCLLSSPTGSGKTLAAFLPIVHDIATTSPNRLQCLYVAPLKALCRDVAVNLKKAWRSIQRAGFFTDVELRIGMRTGDTSQRVRQSYLRHPPNILVTTPESLTQMLAHRPSLDLLRTAKCVVVDEIHAMVTSKRGADLALSLERLERLVGRPLQRIGLSATCTPLSAVAAFLVGSNRPCTIAHAPDATVKHFVVEPLFENLEYSAGWLNVLLDRLEGELIANRATMIFTNTRNLAERLTWALRRRYPERADEIAIHHSAISAARRRAVERRLKHGRVWVAITSTSLELGIDVGSVDQVVFVHPPGGVVRLLQRVGRSGHRPDEPRRGLLLTASASELMEAVVTASSGRDGQIDALRPIEAPLDVLCQQLIGMAITGTWSAEDAFALVRRAAPYSELERHDFDDCLDYLSGRRRDGTDWLPARIRWHEGSFTIADDRTARLLCRNLGTIITEDTCAIHLRDPIEEEQARTSTVGEVDLSFAEKLNPGDRFVLDGRCLELKERNATTLIVDEVFGRPLAPRWLGTGVPMPNDLARRIFLFRWQAAEMLRDGEAALRVWLGEEYHLGEIAAATLAEHLQEQETVSEIPTLGAFLIECVSMQSCQEYFLHTPLPRAANETLARILIDRWRRLGVKAMAVAVDLGIHVIAHGRKTMTPDNWRTMLGVNGFADDWRTHLATSEILASAFGRIAQTGMMVLRNPLGRKRKVGGKDWAERQLFDQIRERVPDFVLLRQAETEASSLICDYAAALAFVERLAAQPIRVRHLAQPSPFGEAMMHGGFQSTTVAGPVNYTAEQP